MKKILLLLFLGITSLLNAQIEVDMAGGSKNEYYKNGAYYIKDINNYMLPYLGTWKYVYGNKEFRIILTKVAKHHVIFPDYNTNYYKDGLRVQYQKFENGMLTFDSNGDIYPSGIIKEFGKLDMSFIDYERNNEVFPLNLQLIQAVGTHPYKLKFKLDNTERLNSYYDDHPNEPYFSVPNDILMEKL